MRSTRSPTEFDQNNRDVTSIPGYVIKKNTSRRAKHVASERDKKMYYQTKQMLKKRPDSESTEANQRYSHECMPVKVIV